MGDLKATPGNRDIPVDRPRHGAFVIATSYTISELVDSIAPVIGHHFLKKGFIGHADLAYVE